MPERTISAVFYNYRDEEGRVRTAHRGQKVDLSDAEVKRGEALGAFQGAQLPGPGYTIPSTSQTGGVHTPAGGGSEGGEGGTVPSELTDEEIDALSGGDLNNACEMAGIDTSTGGSLQDGSLSADEKRQALRAFRDGPAT